MNSARGIPSGELQTEVLRALQKLGKASATDVLTEIRTHRKVAYTTVNTVLDRLYQSGLVKRSKAPGPGGMKYIYSTVSDAHLRSDIVPRTLRSLVSAFGPSVVSAIYEGLAEISKEENDQVARGKRKKQ